MKNALGTLRHPALRLFLFAYATSLLGSNMANVALVFAILGNGGNASDVGLVLTARILPLVLLLLIGGVLSDRFPRRTMMLTADLLRTTSQGGVALLFVLGQPELAPVLLLAALTGIGEALFMPALAGIVPSLVPRERLQDANTLLSVTRSTMLVGGPALAGALVAMTGAPTVLLTVCGVYALSVVGLALLRVTEEPAGSGESLLKQLHAGWRHLRSHTWLWLLILHGALFNFVVWAPYLVLGPVAADRHYQGASSWGLIMAGFGSGAVITGILLLGRRPRRPLLVLTLFSVASAAPLVGIALGAPLPLVILGAAAAGAHAATSEVILHTTIQQRIPQHALSRVMSYTVVGAFVLGPAGLALAGPMSDLVGLHTVLGFGAIWQLAACLLLLCVPAIRELRGDQPGRAASATITGS